MKILPKLLNFCFGRKSFNLSRPYWFCITSIKLFDLQYCCWHTHLLNWSRLKKPCAYHWHPPGSIHSSSWYPRPVLRAFLLIFFLMSLVSFYERCLSIAAKSFDFLFILLSSLSTLHWLDGAFPLCYVLLPFLPLNRTGRNTSYTVPSVVPPVGLCVSVLKHLL